MDVHQAHQQTFKTFHQANLLELISSVNKRTWINLARTELGKSNIKVPSLLLVGDSSPFNEDAAELNSRLNPSITTFAKLQARILRNKSNLIIRLVDEFEESDYSVNQRFRTLVKSRLGLWINVTRTTTNESSRSTFVIPQRGRSFYPSINFGDFKEES